MINKAKVVRWLVNFFDDWNDHFHSAIENKLISGVQKDFGAEADSEVRRKAIEKGRDFYYLRLTTTANILVAVSSLFVSAVALVVSVIALFH